MESVKIGKITGYDALFYAFDLLWILFWNYTSCDRDRNLFGNLFDSDLIFDLWDIVIKTCIDWIEVSDLVLKLYDFLSFLCSHFLSEIEFKFKLLDLLLKIIDFLFEDIDLMGGHFGWERIERIIEWFGVDFDCLLGLLDDWLVLLHLAFGFNGGECEIMWLFDSGLYSVVSLEF